MLKIGDSHNFGKFVYEKDGSIYKPRPIIWEWLFHDMKSPLHNLLSRLFLESQLDCFKLGRLDYNEVSNGTYKVKKLDVKGPSCVINSKKGLKSFGVFLGLSTWFGITDLHSENFYIQKGDNEIKYYLLDVESIFCDLITPDKTNIYYKETDRFDCFKNIEKSKKNIELIHGYLSIIQVLEKNRKSISEIVKGYLHSPIRVILRNTDRYQHGLCHNLFEEEIIQIQRGDIPYFFRYLNSNDVYYYISPRIPGVIKSEEGIEVVKAEKNYNIDQVWNRPTEMLLIGVSEIIKHLNNLIPSFSLEVDNINIDYRKSLGVVSINYKGEAYEIDIS